MTITIRADRGKHGPKAASIDRKIFGMNIADWTPRDYSPPSATYLGLLRALSPGVLRWPAGHRSQEYIWERGGTGQHGNWVLTPAHLDAFVALAKAASSEPLIGMNVKRGTPQAAADMVRYLNVERGYGVRFFYVGNEPDLTDGIVPNPEVATDQFIAYADAMRAVDAKIQLVGPELLTGAHVGGMHGRVDWMTPMLARAGNRVHGISWHYYPLDSGQSNPTSSATMSVAHLFQETASDWRPAGLSFVDEIMPALNGLRDAHAPGASVWITEFAEDPGPGAGAGISDRLSGALWVGDALGRYAEYGPGAVVRFLFKSGEHGYGIVDGSEEPRPTYGAYWLYAQHFGDQVVDAESSALTTVAGHAALRSKDGALTIALVNKTMERQFVHLDVGHSFCANTGKLYALTGETFDATAVTVNGKALTSSLIVSSPGEDELSEALVSDHLFDLPVGPASMTMLVYRP